MLLAHRHHAGVASFLLIPYSGVATIAAAAKPSTNSSVKRTRDHALTVSAVSRTVASITPATVIQRKRGHPGFPGDARRAGGVREGNPGCPLFRRPSHTGGAIVQNANIAAANISACQRVADHPILSVLGPLSPLTMRMPSISS